MNTVVCFTLTDTNAVASQAYSEKRVNHEAQELEKRLNMLSHQSSTGAVSLRLFYSSHYNDPVLQFNISTSLHCHSTIYLPSTTLGKHQPLVS